MLFRSSSLGVCLGTCLGLALCGAAHANQVEVKLVNEGPDGIMAFDPGFVKIKPGDSIKFVAIDQGHSAETLPGMLPDGAKPFKGDIGRDVTVTFDKEGVYGVRCLPHSMIGMVGLVAVGDAYPNLAAAKAVADEENPEAKRRLDADFVKLGK